MTRGALFFQGTSAGTVTPFNGQIMYTDIDCEYTQSDTGDSMTQQTHKNDPFTSHHKMKANLQHKAEFKIVRNRAQCHK